MSIHVLHVTQYAALQSIQSALTHTVIRLTQDNLTSYFTKSKVIDA